MKTVAEMFTGYFKACYGRVQIPIRQKKEIEQAFYGGAMAIYGAALAGCYDLHDKDAAAYLSRLTKELDDYGKRRTAELGRQS